MNYCATIGFFDGVHLGHQFLIQQLISVAQQQQLASMVVTFSAHPRAITEGTSPHLLLTHDERIHRLKDTRVDQITEFDFHSIQLLTAAEFIRLLHEQYHVNVLLMGYDHRFGSDQLSHFADYQQAGNQSGICVLAVPQSPDGNISSTKIRQTLLDGQVECANHFLGYSYTLSGQVIHGQHIGSELGFPTANIQVSSEKLIPQQGVYAALANGKKAIVNIGNNPTFGCQSPVSVEVHIPNFSDNLYGQFLSVQLLHYIRPDHRFANKQDLIDQIHLDLEHLDQLIG